MNICAFYAVICNVVAYIHQLEKPYMEDH